MNRVRRTTESEGLVKGTFKHTAIYSGASMLGRMIGFFMLPFYAHILRGTGYGVIGMIDASLTLLGSLFAYNFNGAVIRIYHEETEPERKKIVVTTGTVLVAMIVLPLAGLGGLVSKPASSLLFGSAEYWPLVCLACATFFLDMVGQTALSILVIKRRSALFSFISLIRLIVGLGLNIFFVLVLRWDLFGFFLAGSINNLVSTAVAVVVMIRFCGVGWDRTIARKLLAYQLPLIPGAIASFLSRQAERIIVRVQLDLAAVGVLEMAYKFPVLINILFMKPFFRSWGTKRLEIADDSGAPKKIGDMFNYFLFVSVLAYLLLAANISTVLQLLTPPEFWPAARVARVEGLQIIVKGVAIHFLFGLEYRKRTDIIARLTIVTSVAKVGLSYLMISLWGIYGAAWSALIASSVYCLWGMILAQRFYRVQYSWRRIGLIVFLGGGLLLMVDNLSTESIVAWGRPFIDGLHGQVESLEGTWLGRWKDGKVLVALSERSELILELIVRTALVCLFLVLVPIFHNEVGRRILGRFPVARSR